MSLPSTTLPMTVIALAALSACAPAARVIPIYDETTRVLLRLDYDYDANGVVDVRTYMRNARPFRLEGDTNQDGVMDRWEYYGGDGQLERVGASTLGDGREDSWAYTSGDELRLELATGRDGVVDRREYYKADVLLRTESDTDRNGRPDRWEEYAGGRLAAVLIDDDGTKGRPTRRLVYGAGAAVRVETDEEGDGRFTPAAVAPAVAGSDGEHVDH